MTLSTDVDALLEVALAGAWAGARVLLERHGDVLVRTKSQAGDLVTDADVASEKATAGDQRGALDAFLESDLSERDHMAGVVIGASSGTPAPRP